MSSAKRIGSIGDVNPIEYGGGYVYQDSETGPWVEWFYGLETEAPDVDDPDDSPDTEVTVFRADLYRNAKEFLSWYDWVDWDDVGRSAGLDDLGIEDWIDRLDTPEDRALVLWDAAGHYGWHEFDQYPLRLTLGELMERWGD